MPARPPDCSICDDSGFVPVHDAAAGKYVGVKPCECSRRRRLAAALQRSRIPAHYQAATLENFATGKNATLFKACGLARRYVDEYTPDQRGGLLFTGPVGTGKTHLAAATLRGIIARGFDGRFTDVRELLKELQHSYGDRSLDESTILNPVLAAPLLVLDELGAARATDWTADIVEHIINTRYNKNRATILTTNYPFRMPAAADPRTTGEGYARPSMRDETLGDRIGARVFSRLQEMVTLIEMRGDDYRARSQKP
jgi:DNA replication protein DnaC